ncbi:MAG: heparan-alpha-glucosaminide N-acetyltransferase domain-containing protein [Chloroflexota bacterium]
MESSRPVAFNAVTGIVDRGRVRAFDLAIGLAVFFMILVHVLWHWGAPPTWTTPIGEAISFAAGPTAAPVFVFLMGASLGAAPRSGFRSLAARGLWLVFLGYVLNFLRGVIPASLALVSGVVTAEEVYPYTLWWLGTTVDLHHMVGLSLVAIAALRVRFEPGWIWIGLAGALVLVAPWLRTVAVGAPILDAPLTPFVGSAPNVYYAVVPWLAYPLGGAVLGRMIARAADPTAVFRRGAILGSGLIAVGLGLIVVQRPGFDVYTYWHQPASFAVAIFGIILVWLAACDLITRRPAIDRRLGVVYGWSRRAIAMYFSHWIIVGWGVGLVGFRDLDLGPVLMAMAAAVVATSYLSRYAVKLESSWWQRRPVGEGLEGAVTEARTA